MSTNNNTDTLSDLKIGCFNCNGLGNPKKREQVLRWLESKEEEIFFLQETHSTTDTEESWRRDWAGVIVFNHGTSNSTGVAILVKQSKLDTLKIANHVNIVPGRATLVNVEDGGMVFSLVNIYAPNNDDTTFLETVFIEASSHTNSDNLIYGGDWNTVLDNNLDKRGGAPRHGNSNCQTFINNTMTEWGYSDIFRLTNSNRQLFTHFDKQHKTHTRLDFFLVDDRLVNFPVCTSSISHGFISDHSYVTLKLQGHTLERGRGYWKFNNSHLKSEEYVREVKNIIQETKNSNYDSYNGLWDTIKFKIKDYSIYYGKKYKKSRLTEKSLLEGKIDRIKEYISQNVGANNNMISELTEAEARLDAIIKEDIDGVITRSKAQWVEHGERSSKYFFGLEKSKGKKKMINKLIL